MAQPRRQQCTATSKRTGERCKRWAAPGYDVCYYHGANAKNPGGAPKRNKNAVKTGEHEAIWLDVLPDDERELYYQVNVDKLAQVNEEIRLLSIRERRMLKRIEDLRKQTHTTVEIEQKRGIEKGKRTDLTTEKYQAVLGQIQAIEEALTRVQAQKARMIEIKHRLETELAGQEGSSLDELARAIEESAREHAGDA
jgi:uncharacterized protein YjcR